MKFILSIKYMPYEIKKLGRGDYEVINTENGKIHAKHTSLTKAKAQIRLLHMVGGNIEGANDFVKREKPLTGRVPKGLLKGVGLTYQLTNAQAKKLFD